MYGISHRHTAFKVVSLSSQCKLLKPHRPNRYPLTVEEVEGVRPLCRHEIFRRLVANKHATLFNKQHRTRLEASGQFGGSPNGCAAARLFLQALLHLHPDYGHCPSDIENAHNSISRLRIRLHLVYLASLPDATENNRDALIYFDLFYALPGPTLVQSGLDFLLRYQTRALDQGDGMAGPFFNSLYSAVISLALSHPDFNLAIPVMIHDDLTIVAPMAIDRRNATTSIPPVSIRLPSTDTHVCPYLAAIIHHLATTLLEEADLTLECSKLHLLHLATPTSPSLAHALISAFPAGTSEK